MTEYAGERERELARTLVESLAPRSHGVLALGSVDLRPAAEHALYAALRAGSPDDHQRGAASNLARSLGRLAHSAVQRQHVAPGPDRGPIMVLPTRGVHRELWGPVGAAIERLHGPRAILVGAETRWGSVPRGLESVALRLTAQSTLPWSRLLAWQAACAALALHTAPPRWRREMGGLRSRWLIGVLRSAMPLLALDSARLSSLVATVRPSLIVCFNESGTISRVAAAVARSVNLRIVDLPHGEAADPWGTLGTAYDRVAVYGPRAANVMKLAGYGDEQIAVIGPLRSDRLIAARRDGQIRSAGRRIVLFASQPANERRAAQHPGLKAAAIRSALAAASAVAPSDLVVVPHPTESDDVADRLLEREPAPDGVRAWVERGRGLHDLLGEAWLLTTVYSQSIFESIIAGVPAISYVPPDSGVPTEFADEGLTLRARDAAEMGQLARSMLDPARRAQVVERARDALGSRVGPLDGAAAERAAALLIGEARLGPRRRLPDEQ